MSEGRTDPGERGPDADLYEFIDRQPISLFHIKIIVLCFLVLWVDGFDTAAIGFIAPALTIDWGVARPALAPVLTAALVGLALGALIGGPVADRIGRKRVIVTSVLLFGLGSLASAFAATLDSLVVLRFITGLGLGAAMPNTTTIVAEYMPGRRRNFLVTLMFCGFTLGSATGGFIAAALVPAFGWRSVLLLGGAMPIVLALALLWLLPESAKFLLASGRATADIKATLQGLDATALAAIQRFKIPDRVVGLASSKVGTLLGSSWRLRTLLLWATYFCGLVIVFLLTSWMPTFLSAAGYSVSSAAVVTAAFQFGGTAGALLVGWLIDRFNAPRVLALSYGLAAVCIVMVGRSSAEVVLLAMATCAAGFFTSGAQTNLNAFAASVYTTEVRATGVSWMSGVGRFGAILGAFIGGPLLAAGWSFQSIFSGLAVCGLVAASSIFMLRNLKPL